MQLDKFAKGKNGKAGQLVKWWTESKKEAVDDEKVRREQQRLQEAGDVSRLREKAAEDGELRARVETELKVQSKKLRNLQERYTKMEQLQQQQLGQHKEEVGRRLLILLLFRALSYGTFFLLESGGAAAPPTPRFPRLRLLVCSTEVIDNIIYIQYFWQAAGFNVTQSTSEWSHDKLVDVCKREALCVYGVLALDIGLVTFVAVFV